jgi:hypothetical protein
MVDQVGNDRLAAAIRKLFTAVAVGQTPKAETPGQIVLQLYFTLFAHDDPGGLYTETC